MVKYNFLRKKKKPSITRGFQFLETSRKDSAKNAIKASEFKSQPDQMASAIPQSLRPLFHQHRTKTRFLIGLNPADKWNNNNNNNVPSSSSRLALLHHPLSNPVHLTLSLCHRFFLPAHPLRLLRRLRSPPFRHFLTLMTTPQAAAPDSTQPSTKTVRTCLISLSI